MEQGMVSLEIKNDEHFRVICLLLRVWNLLDAKLKELKHEFWKEDDLKTGTVRLKKK